MDSSLIPSSPQSPLEPPLNSGVQPKIQVKRKPSLILHEFKNNPIKACLITALTGATLYYTATSIASLVSWFLEDPPITPEIEEVIEPTHLEKAWTWVTEQANDYFEKDPVRTTTRTLSTLVILTYFSFPQLFNPFVNLVRPALVTRYGEDMVNQGSNYLTYSMLVMLVGLATQFYSYFGSKVVIPLDYGEISGGGGNFELPKIETKLFEESLEDFFEWIGTNCAEITFKMGEVGFKFFAAAIGLSIGSHYAKKKVELALTRPVLSRKYQFYDWEGLLNEFTSSPSRAVLDLLLGEKPKKLMKPILAPEIQEQLDEMVQSFDIILENQGTFPNLLLYGPPGTGKSMSAEYIAQSCGMNYVSISGGDIAKYIGSSTSPVEQLNIIFERMKETLLPTVLFIDEFDALAGDRSQLDTSRIELLNTFLNLTGTPSNKVIVIGATNRLEVLDSAASNRFEDKIYLGPPSEQERLAILKMYVSQFFSSPEDEGLFTESYLNQLNERLAGQVGRTIYKLVNKCHLKKMQQPGRKMSRELIDKTFERFFENEAFERKVSKEA